MLLLKINHAKVMGMIENMNLDLAIIDLDMPVVNGFDLIKMIKSNKSFSKLTYNNLYW